MKTVLVAAMMLAAVSTVRAESVYRWTDAKGTIHYSNVREYAPQRAVEVHTAIGHAPAPADEPMVRVGSGIELGEAPSEARPVGKKLHKIYDAERLRFGCYAGGVLALGGWAHPNDIAPGIGCYRYLLGPEAWLNAARAELAVREHGISPKELYQMYRTRSAD